MTQRLKITFIAMIFVLITGLAVEVINPHSFLLTTGALVRVFVLLLVLIGWVWFSKKKAGGQLLVPGVILLSLVACAYLWYGINSFCQETYYDYYQVTGADYSCSQILKEHFFGNPDIEVPITNY